MANLIMTRLGLRYLHVLFILTVILNVSTVHAQLLPFAFFKQPTTTGIAFDTTVASGTSEARVSNITWTHSITSASANPVLVVAVLMLDYSNGGTVPTISSVTYNGVGMTGVGSISKSGDHSCDVQFFYMAAPPTGSHTVSVTLNKAPGNGINGNLFGVSASYTGVNQTSPIDANIQANGFNATATTSLTTTTDKAWILTGVVGFSNAAFTANNGYSVRQSLRGGQGSWNNVDGVAVMSDSNAAVTPAGANTEGFAVGNNYWALQLISLVPF